MKKLWLVAAAILGLTCCASAQSLGPYIQSLPGATTIDNTWSLLAVDPTGSPFQVAPNTVGNAFTATFGTFTANTLLAVGTITPAVPAGAVAIWGLKSPTPALTNNGSGQITLTTGGGLHIQGQGSVNDIVALNASGTTVWVVPTGTTQTVFNGNIGIFTTPIALNPIDIIITTNGGSAQDVRNWNNSTTLNTKAEFVAVTGTAFAFAQFGQQDTASPFSYWRIGAGDTGGINIDASTASGAGIKLIAASGAAVTIVNNATTVATMVNGLQVGSAPTGGDKGAGSINFSGTLWTNGTQGIASRTCTVNQALTLIFTNGILTGGTCVS